MPVEKFKAGIEDPFDKIEKPKADSCIYLSKIGQETGKKQEKGKALLPKLEFLTDPDTQDIVYIGRKRAVLKEHGSKSCAFLGKVFEDEQNGKKVYLDGLNPHIVFIVGSRGSGKSYALGVIAEELATSNQYIGQIVVDPVGVFWSMKYPNQEKKELEDLASWGLTPKGVDNLKVFVPEGVASKLSRETYDETFSMYPSMLLAEDWCLTFGIDRFSPTGLLLEKTLSFVRQGYTSGDPNSQEKKTEKVPGKGNLYNLDDIVSCLQNSYDFKSSSSGYKQDSIRALVSRFEAAKSWGIFSDHGTPLSKLSKEKQLTILDTSFLDDNITALVIGILSRRILSARKYITRQDAIKKFDSASQSPDDLLEVSIPPTWVYIDEAHTLIPSGNTVTPATNAIIEYVKQGRRPGCSMVLATQQPSAINSKVLSQVDIFLCHKLVFNDDIQAVQKRMPAIIPEPYKDPNFIKTLPVGVALTGDRGEDTKRAFILKVKPRLSQHEGRDTETVREIPKLSRKEIINFSADMLYKKLLVSRTLKTSDAKDLLDVVNSKYNSDVTLEELLVSLNKIGVIEKDGLLQFAEKKQKAEIPQDELLSINNVINRAAQPARQAQEQEVQPSMVSTFPSRISKGIAINIAKHTNKKRFLFIKEEEFITNAAMRYKEIYKVFYNVFDESGNYKTAVCYIDSVTGEFLHFDGHFRESTGLGLLEALSLDYVILLSKLESWKSIKDLAGELDAQEESIKDDLMVLSKKGLVDNKQERVRVSKSIDLPFTPSHPLLPSIDALPLRRQLVLQYDIDSGFSEEVISSRLAKLWGSIEITGIEKIYWPVWVITSRDKRANDRTVIVDAVLGQIQYA